MEEPSKQKPKRKRHNVVTFKPYVQNQAWLLPPTLGELIPADHLCRLVNDAIDGMELEPILNTYEGGGSSSYHPRMMLKALVYGYVDKKYSSREIEQALKENICYMWLCGMQRPDHNTLNRFRNSRLKQTVKDVFAQVLAMLVEQGYVRLEEYYVDGTKIESVAGRYTFVWAKNVKRYKEALLDKIAAIIDQIERVNEQSEAEAREKEAQTMRPAVSDSEALKQTIAELNKNLKERLGENKKTASQLQKLESEHLPRLMHYEEQERLLDGRNSYAKTDPDATFMRTKDDHRGTGSLKPCYNILLGTDNQFILNATVHQTPSDLACFKTHMDSTLTMLEKTSLPKPKRCIGDAGFGSEENYEYLEDKDIEAYLKYPGYQQKSNKYKESAFHHSNLYYNKEKDFYVCPMGQHMTLRCIRTAKTNTGYKQKVHYYQAQRCEGCPLRGMCHSAKGERVLRINHRSATYRKAAKERLDSEQGLKMRSQRGVDTEPVFGHIKQCRHFRRFLLKGIQGVMTEVRLLAIAHNLKKWWTQQCKQGRGVSNWLLDKATRVQMEPKSSQMTLIFERTKA